MCNCLHVHLRLGEWATMCMPAGELETLCTRSHEKAGDKIIRGAGRPIHRPQFPQSDTRLCAPWMILQHGHTWGGIIHWGPSRSGFLVG